jgi:hypothetical protein
MTEFNDVELEKDVEDMEEDELRETLTDFMEVHQSNQEAYDATVTEYSEQLEAAEERVSQFKEERAEEAAEYSNVPVDIMVERFSFAELDQIIEEGDEKFSEEDEDDESEGSELLDTEFSEKPEKGRTDTGSAKYRERAKDKLESHW